MKASRAPTIGRLGCGYLLLTVVITCVLLVLNGLIVSNVFYGMIAAFPEFAEFRRAAQAVVFLGPVILLVIQWWAFDVAVDWLSPPRVRYAKKG